MCVHQNHIHGCSPPRRATVHVNNSDAYSDVDVSREKSFRLSEKDEMVILDDEIQSPIDEPSHSHIEDSIESNAKVSCRCV